MGVFSKSQGPANDVKRNAFDGSFENHVTFNFGQNVPVLCKEVMSGDTFEIDSAFGLNFMPTVFPVQSKINASLHYFYVRGKNLWKDYYDWYFGTRDGLVPPYIDPSQFVGKPLTGSIYDYMGLPTTLVGDIGKISYPLSSFMGEVYNSDNFGVPFSIGDSTSGFSPVGRPFTTTSPGSSLTFTSLSPVLLDSTNEFQSSLKECVQSGYGFPCVSTFYDENGGVSCGTPAFTSMPYLSTNAGVSIYNGAQCYGTSRDTLFYAFPFSSDFDITSEYVSSGLTFTFQFNGKFLGDSGQFHPSECFIGFGEVAKDGSFEHIYDAKCQDLGEIYKVTFVPDIPAPKFSGVIFVAFKKTLGKISELPSSIDFLPDLKFFPPFGVSSTVFDIGSNVNVFSSGAVKINALPFRAYESIYNAFYRDSRNNPFIVDGEPEFNKFIASDEGGIDSFPYELHNRNWENDFLTTAQPTPQFGVAPLVGITSAGTMSFSATEDGKTYNVQAEVGDDGTTVNSVSYSENLPASVRRSLVDVVSSGISINDFRNVNAFQRFLETSMRRGLKAFDQIKAHFNVDVDEKILDMPEFIGGVSAVVNSSKVNQTTETDGSPLGSYAGQLSLLSSQKHKIKCYCDQPGYIIGILCVHPVPLYSQLLPKMFTKFDSLDNFFPEFGNIGMQPITMSEVAPVQAYTNGVDTLKDVFGYQRAWYEYLSSVDEVHGLFRTQLRNFVLNRVFDSVPKLGPDFTVIDPKHLNDIFSVVVDNDEEINHKILGKIVFDIKMIRPIPKFGIPRLEPSV